MVGGMVSVQDHASLHEKAVQAVSTGDLPSPPKQRASERRPRTSSPRSMVVERMLWEHVKSVIRPGEQIVIVSEREVWLTNKPERR